MHDILILRDLRVVARDMSSVAPSLSEIWLNIKTHGDDFVELQ